MQRHKDRKEYWVSRTRLENGSRKSELPETPAQAWGAVQQWQGIGVGTILATPHDDEDL